MRVSLPFHRKRIGKETKTMTHCNNDKRIKLAFGKCALNMS